MAAGSSKFTGGLPRWVYKELSPRTLTFGDFRGGLNMRDYPSGLAPNELGYAYNVEINRDGQSISAILGYDDAVNLGLAVIPNGGALAAFPSRLSGGVVIVQDMAGNFWRTSDFTTLTATMAGTPPPAAAGAVMGVDFTSKIVVAAPNAGIYILDPVTWTWSLATAAIMPEMLAVWQNKVWAIRDPAFPTRLWACNAGNAATWTTVTDWVDIRDPNDDPLTCVVATQQQDFQGRPSLLIYKRRSVHRVNSANATAGFSYTTLGTGMGAFGRNCAVTAQGRVVSIDENGLWITDGIAVPVKTGAADKVRPLFTKIANAGLGSATDESGICSIVRDNRVYFSVPHEVTQNLTQLLCYDAAIDACTLVRWDDVDTPAIVYRYASMFTQFPSGNTPRYWLIRKASTSVRQMFIGGPTGSLPSVHSRWQTGFFAPQGGSRTNIRHMRLWARLHDTLTVSLLYDYSETVVTTRTVTGDAVGVAIPRPRDLWSLGKPRTIAFRFDYIASSQLLAWNGAGLTWNGAGLTWGRAVTDGQAPAANVYGAQVDFSAGGRL